MLNKEIPRNVSKGSLRGKMGKIVITIEYEDKKPQVPTPQGLPRKIVKVDPQQVASVLKQILPALVGDDVLNQQPKEDPKKEK